MSVFLIIKIYWWLIAVIYRVDELFKKTSIPSELVISPYICSDLFSKQKEFHEWKIPAGKSITWALFSEMEFPTLSQMHIGVYFPQLVALGEKLRAGAMCQTPQKFKISAIRTQLWKHSRAKHEQWVTDG